MMFRAGLRAWPRLLQMWKVRFFLALDGVAKVHCWNLILILHPSVGTGGAETGTTQKTHPEFQRNGLL